MKEKEYEIFGVKYKESDFPFNTLVISFCLNSSSFSILKDYYSIHSTMENLEASIEELKSLKKGINLIFDRQINKLKGEKTIIEEKERYYSLIDNNGNFELRDYETYNDIHSLYELDDLLNQQDARIKELEKESQKANIKNYLTDYYLVEKENQQLKQSQNQKAIKELEDIRETIQYAKKICGGKATDLDIVSANSYNRCLDDMQKIVNDKIKELSENKK